MVVVESKKSTRTDANTSRAHSQPEAVQKLDREIKFQSQTYTHVRKLGSGTSGRVDLYVCLNEKSVPRFIAMKTAYVSNPAAFDTIRNEVQTQHAMYPIDEKIYWSQQNCGNDACISKIIMAFHRGLTLHQYIQHCAAHPKQALSLAERLSHITSLLSECCRLESLSRVHADFTPHNVVMSPSGARPVDFGHSLTLFNYQTLRFTGVFWGSAMAPPEMFLHKAVTHTSDVYALCGIFIEILSDYPCMLDGNIQRIFQEIKKKNDDGSLRYRKFLTKYVLSNRQEEQWSRYERDFINRYRAKIIAFLDAMQNFQPSGRPNLLTCLKFFQSVSNLATQKLPLYERPDAARRAIKKALLSNPKARVLFELLFYGLQLPVSQRGMYYFCLLAHQPRYSVIQSFDKAPNFHCLVKSYENLMRSKSKKGTAVLSILKKQWQKIMCVEQKPWSSTMTGDEKVKQSGTCCFNSRTVDDKKDGLCLKSSSDHLVERQSVDMRSKKKNMLGQVSKFFGSWQSKIDDFNSESASQFLTLCVVYHYVNYDHIEALRIVLNEETHILPTDLLTDKANRSFWSPLNHKSQTVVNKYVAGLLLQENRYKCDAQLLQPLARLLREYVDALHCYLQIYASNDLAKQFSELEPSAGEYYRRYKVG